MPSFVISVTTTPKPLVSYNQKRRSLGVFNLGTTDSVIIGQNSQSLVAQGYPILVNTGLALLRLHGDEPELDYYIASVSGTQEVRVFEGLGNPDDATGSEA